MKLDDCFQRVTAIRNSTFSNREVPCRYEATVAIELAQSVGKCPYKDHCRRVRENGKLERHLLAAYGDLKVTLAEPSSSLIVRSEHQFHGKDRHRLTLRKHLYQVEGSAAPRPGMNRRYGTDCTSLEASDRLGEYLGFIDLRLEFIEAPLALGFLAIPAYLRSDPRVRIMDSSSGELFNAVSFRGTAYGMQDPGSSGAKCAQACLIMSLATLLDRKAKLSGSFAISFLNSLSAPAGVPNRSSGSCLIQKLETMPEASIAADGMTLEQMHDVLSNSNTSPFALEIDHINDHSATLVEKLLEGYVLAGFPIILLIDTQTWLPGTQVDECEKGHAIVIIGVRYDADGRTVKELIVHDPSMRPYGQRSLAKCLEASRNFYGRNRYRANLVADVGVKRHARPCIAWLCQSDEDAEEFAQFACREAGKDYKIRLVTRREMFEILYEEVDRASLKVFVECCLRDSRFWAILGYRNKILQRAWFFDAIGIDGSSKIRGWTALFVRDKDGRTDIFGSPLRKNVEVQNGK